MLTSESSSKFLSKVPSLLMALLLFLGGCSCSKEEVIVSREELMSTFVEFLKKEARENGATDAQIDEINPLYMVKEDIISEDAKCGGLGFQTGLKKCYRIKVRLVDFLMIEFESERTARDLAYRIDGYVFHNWAFDDVTGEPVLENFVKECFNAQKAE